MKTVTELKKEFKGEKNYSKKVQILGELIDLTGNIAPDIESLDYAMNEAIKLIEKKYKIMSSSEIATLNYFLGIAWLDGSDLLTKANGSENIYRLKGKDSDYCKEKALFAYRSALNEQDFGKLPKVRQAQIITNIANLLSTSGRVVEAADFWERALKIVPNFTMAKGNRAHGLYKYGQLLYDPGHQHAFVYKIIELYDSLTRDKYTADNAWNFFQNQSESFNGIREKEYKDVNWKEFELEKNQEGEYRKWVLQNKLFLNPLNDIRNEPLAASDPFHLPGIVTDIDTGPKYQGMYNQMKQEFVSARFMLYEGVTKEDTHFSDKDVTLINTLDYPSYSINIENVKFAYRSAFSLFDKVAFFLNDYFNLGVDESAGNLNQKVYKKLMAMDTYKQNWILYAMVWLNKDIFEERYEHYVDPDTTLIRQVRNHLEHKYLKIIDMGDYEGRRTNENGLIDDLAFNISRIKFNRKAIKLLKLVRALLIYLSLSINLDQHIKEGKRDKSKIIPSISIDTIDDDWKR